MDRRVGWKQASAQQNRGDTDRDVHEEDPVPAEQVGQDAAEQHADGPSAREHEADHPHRLGALGVIGEEDHDQRQRDRGHDGAAEPLDRARDDQERLGGRQAAQQRRDRELSDPEQEDALLPEEVSEAARQQQEASEREQVGVDDPGKRGFGEAQVGADRRQRDVHDRRVEHDHQIGQTEHVQRQPALSGGQFSHPR
jgi:hypothetical protein